MRDATGFVFRGVPALCALLLTSCARLPQGAAQAHGTDTSGRALRETESARAAQRPNWLDATPLVVAGGWDCEPPTQRRWGELAVDYLDAYEERMSEDTVRRLKEAGVTLVITHYFKGHGLKGEGPYMERARAFAACCRKHGLRVGAYIGNTLCYESLLLEEPRAAEWLVPDYLGKPVTYHGTQTFRRIPYIGHPGYRAYIRRVLKKAVLEAKVDLIHFDNSVNYGRPENFHHPLAIRDFRAFLRNKYSPEQLEDRFGFRDVRHVVPPAVELTPHPMRDPLFQEWTDFRCQAVGEYLEEMRQTIKRLNPEVVVESNPHGEKGENQAWTKGVDWPRILAPTEAVWAEGLPEPGMQPNGAMSSRIRSYLIGRSLGNLAFAQVGHDRLMMAETLAYNRNCLGYVGALLSPRYWEEETRRYVRFFHDHSQYYLRTEPVAPVAVLRTFATMAYGAADTRYGTLLFEQALIEGKIPFDIRFDRHLTAGALAQVGVLVLADQECLSDGQAEEIRAYVAAGGGVVITGATSLYDGWRRRRHRLALRDLFDADLPYPPGVKISQRPWSVDSKWYRHSSLVRELEGFTGEGAGVPVRSRYGKGRAVYLPQIRPGLKKPGGAEPSSSYWKSPANREELLEAVRWAAGRPMPVTVEEAPPYVALSCVRQPEAGRLLAHLVNYGVREHPHVDGIGLTLEIPAGKRVKSVEFLTPDEATPHAPTQGRRTGQRFEVTVPRLKTYLLAVVQWE